MKNDLLRDHRTIVALSTPPGVAGLAIIRICGTNAFQITKRIFNGLPSNPESHRVYYGWIVNSSHEKVDQVLVSWFSKDKSFSGEDTAEISCHGSPVIYNEIIKLIIANGAYQADRGEFTFRAYKNGKVDLIQAESILSLVHSRSILEARAAVDQLTGKMSNLLKNIEYQILRVAAEIEASIDFSTEDIGLISIQQLVTKIESIEKLLSELISSYQSGRVFREGVSCVLVGATNAGKSSLFNSILNDQRAIVSDQHGTTRDFIESEIHHNGLRMRFIDTAGIRLTNDPIEKIGIESSMGLLNKADIILHIIDLSSPIIEPFFITNHRQSSQQKYFVVLNKFDLVGRTELRLIKRNLQNILNPEKIFLTSNKYNFGIKRLLNYIHNIYFTQDTLSNPVVMHFRHFENLTLALRTLADSRKALLNGVGFEFVSVDIKDSLHYIHNILGLEFHDQIMDTVFKEFCIGK